MKPRLIASIVLIAGGIILFVKEVDYPFPWRYPVRGIDISHYQGVIDWEKLRSSGIDFVYIKATEGVDYNDGYFKNNWQGAGRAGIKRGAYHFFSLMKDGTAQARHFSSSVALSECELPPAVDLEFPGKNEKIPTPEHLATELKRFEDELRTSCPIAPVYYMNEEFYERYFKTRPAPERLWIRGIYHKPAVMAKVPYLFWQYSSIGYENGVSGPIDLDVFNGTAETFSRLLHNGKKCGK
jgi:lysozyme